MKYVLSNYRLYIPADYNFVFLLISFVMLLCVLSISKLEVVVKMYKVIVIYYFVNYLDNVFLIQNDDFSICLIYVTQRISYYYWTVLYL